MLCRKLQRRLWTHCYQHLSASVSPSHGSYPLELVGRKSDMNKVAVSRLENQPLLTQMMKMPENASLTRVTTLIPPTVVRLSPEWNLRMTLFPQHYRDGSSESFSIKFACVCFFFRNNKFLCSGKVLAHNQKVSGSQLSARTPKCNMSSCYFRNVVDTYENECPQHSFIPATSKCSAKSCSIVRLLQESRRSCCEGPTDHQGFVGFVVFLCGGA